MLIFEEIYTERRMWTRTKRHASKHALTLLLAMAAAGNAHAQTSPSYSEQLQDLAMLFDSLKTSENDSARHDISRRISAGLGTLLTDHDSTFHQTLAELPYLGKCYSDDGELRLYSWNYPLNDRTYGYGGYIQFKPTKKNSHKAKPIALQIAKEAYVPTTGAKIAASNWYGALYYKAIKSHKEGQDYYVLFGWGGNDATTDFKTVETLKISQNKKTATFGGTNAFASKGRPSNRIVLQYNSSAKVALDYHEAEKRIVMDHLSPSDPFYKDIYSYYGPDFSYDAYNYDKKAGLWRLEEDVDQKNKD